MNIVYGFYPVKHLLEATPEHIESIYIAKQRFNPEWQALIHLSEKQAITLHYTDKKQLQKQFKVEQHQGIIAVCKSSQHYVEEDLYKIVEQAAKPLLLILDGIQDPHNLGACLRTANAAGVNAVIAAKDRAVGLTPVVRKVAAGAAESTPFIQVTNLARTMRELQENGIWIIGTSDKATVSLYQADLTMPLALVMGAEGKGIRQLTEKTCDQLISIPMSGSVSSLNVSVATGVCLFEVCRQRL